MNETAHRPYSVLASLALVCIVATTPLHGAFHSWAFLARVVVVVGMVFGTFAYGWSRQRAAEAAALGALLAGLAIAVLGGASALSGLASGWRELLSVSVPAPMTGEFLAVPMAIAAIGAIGAVSALFATKSIGVALVAPTLGFVTAYAYGVGGDVPNGTAIAYTASVLTVLGVAHAPRARQVFVAGTVACCFLLVFAMLHAPHRTPADPRTAIRPDAGLFETANPLTLVAAYQATGETGTVVYEVHASAPLGGTRVRLAVLDRLGPEGWEADEEFTRVGARLPEPENSPPLDSSQFTVEATRYDNALPWLPVIGTPSTASASDALYATPRSGALLSRGSEISYRTRLPAVASNVAVEDAGVSPSALAFTDCPRDLVPGAAEIGRELLAQSPTPAPYDVAGTVVGFVKQYRGYERSAPGFQAPAVLDAELRTLNPQNPYGQWNVEAYVASVTTLLRCAGVPARVAIGSVLPPNATDSAMIDRASLTAWPEILLSGYGWQAINTLPAASEEADAIEVLEAAAAGELPTPTTTPPLPDIPVPAQAPAGDGGGGGIPTTLVLLFAFLAAAVGAVVGSWRLRKVVRHRRAHAADPTWRVRGAWEEYVDIMRIRERTDLRALTTAELADRSAASLGADTAAAGARLAVLANRALFAPVPCTDEEAAQAWSELGSAEASIEPALSKRDRVRDVARIPVTIARWRSVRHRQTFPRTSPPTTTPSDRPARPTPDMFIPTLPIEPNGDATRADEPPVAATQEEAVDIVIDHTPKPAPESGPDPAPDDAPDDALEHIVDLRRIARLADRRIFAATDARRGESVAVILYVHSLPNEDARSRARARAAEAQAASIAHEHLVTIRHAGIAGTGSLFLVTDALPDSSLARQLGSDRFQGDADDAVALGTECCIALAALHRGGLAHGDVQPDNIWITEDGHVRLGPIALGDPGSITANPFAAPEARDGRAPDPRSDVYSVAMIVGAVATGRPVQPGESRSPETVLGPLADVRALCRALDPDPARRPASATALWEELQSVASATADYPARP